MANTISLSPKPGIKCFHETPNTKLHDTTQAKLRKVTRLAKEGRLWTGESTQCGGCNHHVEQHCTRDHCDHTINRHCHGNNELCNCKSFIPLSVTLSHRNCYKMVTEDLANV